MLRPLEPAVRGVVFDAVAALCRVERAALRPSTVVLDVHLDSLTLIALMTRVELAFGVELGDTDIVELVTASTLGELCAQLVRRLETQQSRRSPPL